MQENASKWRETLLMEGSTPSQRKTLHRRGKHIITEEYTPSHEKTLHRREKHSTAEKNTP